MSAGKITSISFLALTIFFFSAVMVLAAKPSVVRGEDATNTPKATPPGLLKRSTDAATVPGKLKSCQARQEAVKKRSTQIVRFSDNMITKFASISARVQNFYTNKVVTSGKTVASYSALVADIEAKKASALAAVAEASSTSAAFNCDSAPKEQLTAFKQDMKTVIGALKEYRKSIRNLIVAVHTALGEGGEKLATGAARNKNKLTPTITASSTATPTPTSTATSSGGTQ